MDELSVTYKLVPGYENYRVGTDGSLWSKNKNTKKSASVHGWHLINGGLDKDGYRKAILCRNGERKYVRVHVIVLSTFKGGPQSSIENPVAAHENGDVNDNRLVNLKWKSQKDNIGDKVRHGTSQAGERHPQSRLTSEKVTRIRELRRDGWKWKDIAGAVGEKLPTVYAAGSGKNWRHL